MFLSRGIAGTIVKILIACLVVGFVLSTIGVTPASIVARLGGTIHNAFETVVSLFMGTMEYLISGAVVVIPIWLMVVLLRRRWK